MPNITNPHKFFSDGNEKNCTASARNEQYFIENGTKNLIRKNFLRMKWDMKKVAGSFSQNLQNTGGVKSKKSLFTSLAIIRLKLIM